MFLVIRNFMPSTVIKSYHYFSEQQILRIVYISGSVYDYLEVPQMVFDEFRGAFSKGTFLNKHIKGKFNYVKN